MSSVLIKVYMWTLVMPNTLVLVMQFICDKKEHFWEKETSHKYSTLAFEDFVAAVATVGQEPHFWRTDSQELFAFPFD